MVTWSPMIDPEWLKVVSADLLTRPARGCSCTRGSVAPIVDGRDGARRRSSRARRAAARSSPRSSSTPPATSTCAPPPAPRTSPTSRARAPTSSTASTRRGCGPASTSAGGSSSSAASRRPPRAARARAARTLGYLETPHVALARRRRPVHGPAPDRLQRPQGRRPDERGDRVAPAHDRPPRVLPPRTRRASSTPG